MRLAQMLHEAGFEFEAVFVSAEEASIDEGNGGHGDTPGMRGLSAAGDQAGEESLEDGDQAPVKIRPRSIASPSPPSDASSGYCTGNPPNPLCADPAWPGLVSCCDIASAFETLLRRSEKRRFPAETWWSGNFGDPATLSPLHRSG